MQVTLTFNRPEDDTQFQEVINASKYKGILVDLQDYLRQEIKYNDGAYTDDEYAVLCNVREKLFELINEEGLVEIS